MRLSWPEWLRSDIDLGDLLELGLFVLFYWLLPAMRRRHKGIEEMADPHEESPDEPPELPDIFPESPIEPESAYEEPARLLREAMAGWRIRAEPVIGSGATSQVARLIVSRFPDLTGGAGWGHEELGAAEALTRALNELSGKISDRSDPTATLLLACTRDLLRRPRLSGGIPVLLYPVNTALGGLAEQLLNAAGVIPITLLPPLASHRRRLRVLEDAVGEHLSRQDQAIETMIQQAVDELAMVASRDQRLDRVVRTLLMKEDAGEEVFRAVVRVLFMAETGALVPAHLTSESALGWPWYGDLASAVTLHLGAGVPDAPPAQGIEESSALAWEQVGAAVAQAVGTVVQAVGTVVEVDPEVAQRQNTVAQWLLRGAVGAPDVPFLHPLEAVNSWRLAELAGAVIDVEDLSRLQAVVDGTLKREEELEIPRDIPEAVPDIPREGRPGRRELVDAVALHIILGAPRSRRHPAFRVGPLPLWRRAVR